MAMAVVVTSVTGGENVPVEHHKKLSAISATSIRNMVRNKATGEYTIVFTPCSSAMDVILEVRVKIKQKLRRT